MPLGWLGLSHKWEHAQHTKDAEGDHPGLHHPDGFQHEMKRPSQAVVLEALGRRLLSAMSGGDSTALLWGGAGAGLGVVAPRILVWVCRGAAFGRRGP